MLQVINSAILEAFNESELERLVRFGMNVELEHITTGSDLTEKVFDLTRWAEKSDKLDQLVRALKQQSMHPAIHQLPDITGNSSTSSKRMNNEQLSLLNFRLQVLERAVEDIRKIVTGEKGDNGMASAVRDNSRSVEEIRKVLARIETGMMNHSDALTDRRSTIALWSGVIISATILIIIAGDTIGWF